MRAYADHDPSRAVVCDRCGLKYRPEQITRAGDGSWKLCSGCLEAIQKKYLHDLEAIEDEDYSRRVAHEGQFEDEAQDEPYSGHVTDENESLGLLVRTTAGLLVEALQGFIVVTQNGKSEVADVADEDLLDAFRHPALYLSAEQCAAIDLR